MQVVVLNNTVRTQTSISHTDIVSVRVYICQQETILNTSLIGSAVWGAGGERLLLELKDQDQESGRCNSNKPHFPLALYVPLSLRWLILPYYSFNASMYQLLVMKKNIFAHLINRKWNCWTSHQWLTTFYITEQTVRRRHISQISHIPQRHRYTCNDWDATVAVAVQRRWWLFTF